MIDFEQWYEQEIGSENKPEYEAAKWAWEYQQKKLDCCREENKAHLEKINELQARVDISEKLRDSQFEKLWSLTQAIEKARNGADEDFDLFLNYLSNILKGDKDEN